MKVTRSFRALIPGLLSAAHEICSSASSPVHCQALAGWFNLVLLQLAKIWERSSQWKELFLEHAVCRGKAVNSGGRRSEERAL